MKTLHSQHKQTDIGSFGGVLNGEKFLKKGDLKRRIIGE